MDRRDTRPASAETPLIARVALQARAPGLYDYLIPPGLETGATVGQAVLAPLGARQAVLGYILALSRADVSVPPLKPLKEIIAPEPLFGPSLSNLIGFIADYYHYPPGQVVREILPGGLSPGLIRVLRGLPAALRFQEPLLGAEAELLSRLGAAGNDGLDLKKLAKEGFGPAARRLAAAGRAETGWRLALSSSPIKTEWWLGPAAKLPEGPPPRLGPKEAKLWLLARTGPPKPLSYFSHYLSAPLPQARRLAARGLLTLTAREIFRDDPNRALYAADEPPPSLTGQQAKALAAIEESLAARRAQGFLLFGVTGSGKTEVYLRAAAAALALGREVLWLTPEIGLTLSLEGLLKRRLGPEKVAVLHSGLTPAQRLDQWRRIRRGLAPVVLGARSAVFAPLERLGLAVVDEEHDWAYKQEDGLRYQARDLARRRALEASAVLALGSATPSFESYQAALNGRLTLLEMTDRPGPAVLPQVEIIDLRAEPDRRRRVLSPPLSRALDETLSRGEQALLFLNRRGLAGLPLCLDCGQALICPHCSRTLTLHGPERPAAGDDHALLSGGETLICHACGFRAEPPAACPNCRSPLVRYFGAGTERVLKIALENRPQARGERLDADSTRERGGLKRILEGFARGEFNILAGTQMAAKGHDFPNLTLVGVVDADLGLNLPDFRAAERTFQILSQVAGRAGRADRPGRVFIQTLAPRHPVIQAAADHDYRAFFKSEIEARRELGYPPFGRLALIRFSGQEEAAALAAAEAAAETGRRLAGGREEELEILGPAPAPLAQLRGRYRFQILIRASTARLRRRFLSAWLPAAEKSLAPELTMTTDIDPYHFL